ncbi:trichome birefringence-like protein 3 [Tanacetum coccineum]
MFVILMVSKILGRDGKPMQPYRNVKLGTDKEVFVTSDEPIVGTQPNKGGVDDSQPKGWWEMRAMVNHEKIDNSDFVLPITAIHAMKHKFENSLFAPLKGLEEVLKQGSWLIRNIPLMLTKWSPKDKVTKVSIWVKLNKVPVVAYSEDGLSLIATQIGNPVMLDVFTSAMCVDVPNINDEVVSHTLEKIKVEYEWKPPHCLECHVFGHAADQCPKHVHEKPKPTVETSDDGFTTVVNKRSRGKGVANPQRTNKGSFSRVRVNNPNQNFVYQPVKKAQKPSDKEGNNEENNNGVKLKTLFEKLNEITSVVDPSGDDCEAATIGDTNKKIILIWMILTTSVAAWNIRGLKSVPKQSEVRQVVNENQLSVCAILESRVDLSSLSNVCSRVFKTWDWTSNANLCTKGCRNLPSERRQLWSDLVMHKYVVRGFPWVLIGDFNVALN